MMNERIQQLAEQALEYAEKNQSADIPRHWFRLYNEKFAQLIVRECIDIADEYDGVGSTIVSRIREHFGVEE
jgi:lysophospholipase L1-like esterase